MIPQKTIEELINKHLNLEKDLSSGEIDKKKFAEKSKEYSDINEIIAEAKKYLSFENDIELLSKIKVELKFMVRRVHLDQEHPSHSTFKVAGVPHLDLSL